MRSARAAAALSAALAAATAAAALPVPPLTGPVVDLAGAVDAASADRLAALARSARAGGRGPQLQVLVVRSLDGEPIEDFSLRVAEAWRIGTKGRDDGVLVTVAIEDRKVRIEVGGGLEGALTDAGSARIVRRTIAPAFRERRYGPGLVAAAEEILAALGVAPAPAGAVTPDVELPAILRLLPWAMLLFPLGAAAVLLLFVVLVIRGRARGGAGEGWSSFGAGSSYDSGGSGSSFSSSSDSGGGWSGGGGGFSGGGASGSW